ncbi:MAG: metallophosphoesterase family protein [Mycobacteriales bacterium]
MTLFASERRSRAASTGGRTIYAVGDVHGRLDLLESLLRLIHDDAGKSPPRERAVLVFVGDYIDRGPASRGVIARLIALKSGGEFELRTLKGNHEEALLAFLEDPAVGTAWCDNGGASTLASYGVRPPKLRTDSQGWARVRDDFAEALPADHVTFLRELELAVVYGDYVFVHAGLRPGVPLRAQREHDLLWIRHDFLNWPSAFEKVVVHGHTPAEAAYVGRHRIGIDTGAYATGLLTAVRLHDGECSLIQAGERRG